MKLYEYNIWSNNLQDYIFYENLKVISEWPIKKVKKYLEKRIKIKEKNLEIHIKYIDIISDYIN